LPRLWFSGQGHWPPVFVGGKASEVTKSTPVQYSRCLAGDARGDTWLLQKCLDDFRDILLIGVNNPANKVRNIVKVCLRELREQEFDIDITVIPRFATAELYRRSKSSIV
jgi:hypothetical protein